MAVTRAKATALLNATEMGLYDDSRANALRGHSEAQLARFVTRARTARDRARDLEKRQRLASRTSTGSKSGRSGRANVRTGEKAELLADILKRFESQHRDAAKAAKAAARTSAKAGGTTSATSRKAAAATKTAKAAKTKTAKATKTGARQSAKATTAGKAARAQGGDTAKAGATKTRAAKAGRTVAAADGGKKVTRPRKTGADGTGATVASSRRAVSPKPTGTAKASKSTAAKKTGAKRDASATKRRISPRKALENTRALLARQEEEAAQPKHWDGLGGDGTAQSAPGFQSPQARSKALRLHAAETRQAPINGSISTRDRKNQGKRDHRSKTD